MKFFLCLCAALMLTVTPITAKAATDVTGTWTGQMQGPDGGDGFQLSVTLKQDGDKLTGTITGPQGDPMPITNGKVDGAKISFTVTVTGMDLTISQEGTLNAAGDEIKLTAKSDQGPMGELTLKKSKS